METQLTIDRARVGQLVEHAVATLDQGAVARSYRGQGEFVFVERLLPDELTRALADEAAALRPLAARNRVPFVRRAGTVVHSLLLERAPLLVATYRAPALLELLGRLGAEARSDVAPNRHASANLYYYDVAGDWMKDHYDACRRCDVGSQTVVLGLVDRSTQRLRCHVLGAERLVQTTPGSLVVFNTANTFHGVSPLGPDEERVVACASYTTTSKSVIDRAVSAVQESLLYYSPRDMLRALRRRGRQETP